MTGGIHKILLVSIVCFCMTLAFPVDDKEKGKSTEAPLAASEHVDKVQEKEPKLKDPKAKDEAHTESSSSSNEKQKEPLQKPAEIELPQKAEHSLESKDHSEKPSEQTTLSSTNDHQKPHDQNDQIAVPTEEKKDEQKDVELRHLPSEISSVGSFIAKEPSIAATKLEHGKKEKDDHVHHEKNIEEAVLASTGSSSDKKPEEKALPESTPASDAKDDQKTTSDQLITESSSKAEAADGHSTSSPGGASTTISENQSEHENKPHHEHQPELRSDLSHESSEPPTKDTTESSQQQTTAGIQEQTSTSASVANTSNNPNL